MMIIQTYLTSERLSGPRILPSFFVLGASSGFTAKLLSNSGSAEETLVNDVGDTL